MADKEVKKDNQKTSKKTTNKNRTPKGQLKGNRPLTPKQKKFCKEYVKTSNGAQSAIKAGYSKANARVTASHLLTQNNIKQEIARITQKSDAKDIADAQEVMEYFTKVLRGEIKDQFGLDASLNERTKAAQELAKRTIDVDNRQKGIPDNQINIQINWDMD